MVRKPRVLLATVGNRFEKGVYNALALAASQYGFCDILIQGDICIRPIEGVNAMRNCCVMMAVERGYDYLLIMDNDVVLPDYDPIGDFILRKKDILVPWFEMDEKPPRLTMPQVVREGDEWREGVEFIGNDRCLASYPRIQPDALMRLDWAVVSCMMFDTVVFKRIGLQPFPEALITNWDEYACRSWRLGGAEIWQDLNIWVKLLRPPGRLYEKVLNG